MNPVGVQGQGNIDAVIDDDPDAKVVSNANRLLGCCIKLVGRRVFFSKLDERSPTRGEPVNLLRMRKARDPSVGDRVDIG